MENIIRGDIFYADLGENKDKNSEQVGIRPVLIISNNMGNKYSPTVIIAPLTSQIKRTDLPVHIILTQDKENGLEMNSVVLLEQIKTIDKKKLFSKLGTICEEDLEKVNKSLLVSLGL